MDLGLKDRVFIVTGGSGALMRAAAQCLVAEGARVVLAGRDAHQDDGRAGDRGSSAAVRVVSDADGDVSPERLVSCALDTWDRLDGALIGVAPLREGNALEVADEEWAAAFRSVFLDAVNMIRGVSRTLKSGGSVALVLSPRAGDPWVRRAVANGLEAGLASFAVELAVELGPQGIRVNGLVPTLVDGAEPGVDAPVGVPSTRQLSTSEEFARVAAFVLSPAASYVSGTMVSVDSNTPGLSYELGPV
jgi:3-oxoacyl-[acyl-carrier protein] reductase